MNKVTLTEVLSFIESNEFTALDHQRIVEACNRRTRENRARAKEGLRQGMMVTFRSSRTGLTVVGKIDKVNRVNVDITEQCVTGPRRWRVSPGLLRPA